MDQSLQDLQAQVEDYRQRIRWLESSHLNIWTPILVSTGATFGYTSQAGRYSVLNGICQFSGYMKLSGAPTGTTTNATSIYLPVVSANIADLYQVLTLSMTVTTMPASGLYFSADVAPNSNLAVLFAIKSGAAVAIIPASAFVLNSEVLVSGNYFVG